MREALASVHFWTYALIVVSLCPLAAVLGASWGWTAGTTTFVVLAGPICLAALTTNVWVARLIACLACIGCFLEPTIALRSVDNLWPAFPASASCVLLALSMVISAVTDRLRCRVHALQSQNTEIVRELYQSTHHQNPLGTNPPATDPTAVTEPVLETSDETLNYPMLLLSIQEIGRRISTNLELESLYPTIINCAKTTLECGSCQIHLWAPGENNLVNPLALRPRDPRPYRPQTTSGMAGWVVANRQLITRQTIERDANLESILTQDPHAPDAIAPLSVGGELLGLLVVDQVREDSNTFVRLLYILANISALAIKNAQLFTRIELMAHRDGLTGLLNHNTFHQELERLIDRSTPDSTLSVIMGDVDHFKKINDDYGHPAGDHVLRETARLWKAVLPDEAVIARYGGEEFICLLPNYDLSSSMELAQVLQQTLQDFPFSFEGSAISVTASFGVTQRTTDDTSDDVLIRRADEAMYRSKTRGRNQVTCLEDNHGRPPARSRPQTTSSHDDSPTSTEQV